MTHVVFLRAANVGGHQVFRPAAMAKEMANLDVVSIGAAGTFVVRGKATQATVRAEFARHLPFKTELMICPAREVAALSDVDPFANAPSEKVASRYVTIVQKPIAKPPKLPHEQPPGGKWGVSIIGLSGRFVLSLRRRTDRPGPYANEVVEKLFRVSATTRNWNTIEAIRKLL